MFNPDYQLAIGDKVHLQIWGALQYSETLTIDNQGNLFIPEVSHSGFKACGMQS